MGYKKSLIHSSQGFFRSLPTIYCISTLLTSCFPALLTNKVYMPFAKPCVGMTKASALALLE